MLGPGSGLSSFKAEQLFPSLCHPFASVFGDKRSNKKRTSTGKQKTHENPCASCCQTSLCGVGAAYQVLGLRHAFAFNAVFAAEALQKEVCEALPPSGIRGGCEMRDSGFEVSCLMC